MRKLHIPLLMLAFAIGAFVSGRAANAMHTIPLENAKTVCSHHGGMTPGTGGATGSGCFWCGTKVCQWIGCDIQGRCSQQAIPAKVPPKGVRPVFGAPIVNGKPIQALPSTGSNPTNPTNAAPINSVKPDQPLPRGGGGGKLK
jgi:hypothetical protein